LFQVQREKIFFPPFLVVPPHLDPFRSWLYRGPWGPARLLWGIFQTLPTPSFHRPHPFAFFFCFVFPVLGLARFLLNHQFHTSRTPPPFGRDQLPLSPFLGRLLSGSFNRNPFFKKLWAAPPSLFVTGDYLCPFPQTCPPNLVHLHFFRFSYFPARVFPGA